MQYFWKIQVQKEVSEAVIAVAFNKHDEDVKLLTKLNLNNDFLGQIQLKLLKMEKRDFGNLVSIWVKVLLMGENYEFRI